MKSKIIIISIIFLFVSCEIFSIRDSELPDSDSDEFLPATTPTILFDNLKKSFEKKNVENYVECFANSSFTDFQYRFYPTANAVGTFPVFEDWNISSEQSYFTNLVSSLSDQTPISLALTELGYNQYADSAVYNFAYDLLIFPNQNENIVETYKGNLKFTIIQDSRNQWVIYKWWDYENDNPLTFSQLKGDFY